MNDLLEARFAGPNSPTNMQLGYFFMRVMLGGQLFFHGFMRFLTGLGAWVDSTMALYEGTYLPEPFLNVTLHLIPLAELIIGALVLLGWFTRWAILASVSLFVVLLYGHTVRQNWSIGHVVVHYGIYYWVMFVFIRYNWLALDNLGGKQA